MKTESRSAHLAALTLAMPLAAVLAATTTLHADVFTDIKYTDLVARLGLATPTGAGIGIGQVEAPENAAGSYAPDTLLAEFSGKTINLLSGTGLVASWHATEVAKNLYGNTLSIAGGVTSISSWQVNPWITGAYLRVGSGSASPPLTPPAGVRVFNHSWIGSFGAAASDNDALRRLDFTVSRDNIFIASGTNNGAGSVAQPMMAYAFNGVTVGLADGNHSNGLTPAGIDGPNRRKPDIVAPGQFTSFSTPVVGAAAAILFDAADSDPAVSGNSAANRAITVKAALLAGTTHRAAWSNGAPATGPSRGVTTTALDPLYGADLLNIDRAHRIFTGGEANGSSTVLPTTFLRHQGWDYLNGLASGGSIYWTFRVHTPVDEVSVVATWHRQVASTFTTWNMMDLDLRLMKLVGGVPTPISGDAGIGVFASGNCESNGVDDNTEHLFLRGLAAGDYVLQLSRKAGTQTAMPIVVAWYMPNTTVAGDLNGDGIVGAPDLATLLNQWGGPGSGDLDGSGSVDAADIAALLSNWG
jgi:hypothetical protein